MKSLNIQNNFNPYGPPIGKDSTAAIPTTDKSRESTLMLESQPNPPSRGISDLFSSKHQHLTRDGAHC